MMEVQELWTQVQAILENNPDGVSISEIRRQIEGEVSVMFLSGHLKTMAYLGRLRMVRVAPHTFYFRKE